MIQNWRKLQWFCAVLGGFLIQITLGSVYTYGRIGFNCYPSNVTHNSSAILAHCNQRLMYLYLFTMFGLSATMTLGGYVKDKLGLAFTLLIGSSIFSSGIFCSTFTYEKDNLTFQVTYGLISALGGGLINSISISECCKHFTRKGLLVGITLSGFSLGPIMFDIIQKIKAHKEPEHFIVLGAAHIIIQLISLFLLWISERRLITEYSVNTYGIFGDRNDEDIKPHNLIFEYDFWIIWITFLLNAPGSIIMVTLQKVIEVVEPDNFTLNFHFYIYCFAEFIGRIFWGFLIDRFAYKNIVTIIALGSTSIAAISFLCFSVTGEQSSNKLYNIIMILNYFWLSGNYSVFPSIIVKRFGQKYFDKNYGLLWTAYSFAGVVISVTIGNVHQNSLSFKRTCAGIAVLHFISFLVSQAYVGNNRRIHLKICGYQIS